jgi:hypothetical protein
MKRLVIDVLIFAIPLIGALIFGLLLPATPYSAKSLLMSQEKKDDLLRKTPTPRIIFIGGSNLSFGLNSQLIKDSLKLNPINTAIHASIGIKFMVENTEKYLQKGDVVVLIPEYNHYYRDLDFGSKELLRMVFDVNRKHLKMLNLKQLFNLLPHVPKYCLTKFLPIDYLGLRKIETYYSVDAFNQYGDTHTHWGLPKQAFAPYGSFDLEFNKETIVFLESFNQTVKNKGGLLLVSFPCFQEASYKNSESKILKVQEELLKSKLTVIGSPERYKIPETLMFNTPYHLNKEGTERRTQLLIEDIKKTKAVSQN